MYFLHKNHYFFVWNSVWFDLIRFYGISTTFGYLMPNPIYTYTLNIYDLEAHFVDDIFEQDWAHFLCPVKWFRVFLSNTNNSLYNELFVCTNLNRLMYCYVIVTI